MPFYDLAKHHKTISKTTFWSIQKIDGIPYKTCRFLMIFEPKTQNDLKWSKSIRFFTINHMAFRHVENLIKPVENEDFWEPTFGLLDGLSGPAGRPKPWFPGPFWSHLFFSWRRAMMLTMMQKKIVFCIIGRPVFSGLFSFPLAIYYTFLRARLLATP